MDWGTLFLGGGNWLAQAAQETAGAAARVGAPEFPFWQNFFRVMIVLSGMIGVLLLGLHLWKRSGFLQPKGGSPLIQVLATHYLAPKKALILVAVGQERLLLANAGDQLQLVTALAREEDAPLAAPAPPSLNENAPEEHP